MKKYTISHKLISSLIIAGQVFSLCFFCVPVYASVNIETEEFTKQEQIDELFTELNELALEKKVQLRLQQLQIKFHPWSRK